MSGPLDGRVAVITGVSRRTGIGYATAGRLAALGADLFLHHYAPHDREQPWGADPDIAAAFAALPTDATIAELDLAGPSAPAELIKAATDALGHVDILVCNHARSGGDGPLGTLTAAMLDAHWAVTRGPRSCSSRPSPPSTTAARVAGSSC